MDDTQVLEHNADTGSAQTPDVDRSIDHSFERPGERRDDLRGDIEDAAREHGVEFAKTEDEADEHKTVRSRERQERKQRERAQRERARSARGDATESDVQPTEAEAGPGKGQAEPSNEPPTSWTREAKAEWGKLPARIQQEIRKREDDMQRGVAQLRQGYEEIDQALAPWHGEMQAFGKTPGQTIAQLFAWYDALEKNPDAAVPALLQSYRYPVARLVQAYGPDRILRELGWHAQRTPQGQILLTRNPQAAQQQDISAQVQQAVAPYIQYVQQQDARRQAEIERVNEDNTRRYLDDWAKDKPYFNDVRKLMATLLTPDPNTGQASVPLKDDHVDLDTAYKWAVRAKKGDQFAAQRDKARRARSAASSIAPSSPGPTNGARPQRERPRSTSVRDSIRDAIVEVGGR